METIVDKFGRVVIPKRVRNHLGLEPGSILEVEEHDDEVILKVVRTESPIKVEEGIAVFTGKAVGNLESALQTYRDERLKDLWGK